MNSGWPSAAMWAVQWPWWINRWWCAQDGYPNRSASFVSLVTYAGQS
jgi:hypothetical protein